MAYSVLIVDDDRRIREGLIRHIDWEVLGFDIPMQVQSALEALEIFKYKKIDVLITDIRMPAMSGLELSEKVSASYVHTVIVILSGYSDFQYAKTAMKYGIRHYITKPTDLDQFSKVLTGIKNDLEAKKQHIEQIKDMEKRYNTAVEMLLEQFFVDISHGAIKSEITVQNFMSKHNIHFPFSYFNVITVDISDFENTALKKQIYDSNQFSISIKNMLKIILNDYNVTYYTYSTTDSSINIILNFDDNAGIAGLSESLYEYCRNIGGVETLVAVSSSVTNLRHISICYNQVQEILSLKQHAGVKGVVRYADIESSITVDINYPSEKEKLLLSYITNMESPKAKNIIDSIFLPLVSYRGHLDTCREYMVKLLFAIESCINDFNIDIKDIFGEKLFPLKKALEFRSSEDIIFWLKEFTVKVINHLNDIKLPYSYRFVEKTKDYIEENYMKDITLFSASEAVHLSPTYISKIFKKTTGYNFIEYLSMTRVNKAKLLLSDTNSKIYEVGTSVGYKSIKHFSQVFKSYTGMTPTEYRESVNIKRM